MRLLRPQAYLLPYCDFGLVYDCDEYEAGEEETNPLPLRRSTWEKKMMRQFTGFVHSARSVTSVS
jgi:hypothetical protein